MTMRKANGSEHQRNDILSFVPLWRCDSVVAQPLILFPFALVSMVFRWCSLLQERGVAIAHCPLSNAALASGTCPVKDILERYEPESRPPLGLATDVAGGWSPSMFESMKGVRRACLSI